MAMDCMIPLTLHSIEGKTVEIENRLVIAGASGGGGIYYNEVLGHSLE